MTRQGDKLHVEEYPEAVALKRIDDPVARQLQAMHLHHSDLTFCRAALRELVRLDCPTQPLLAKALWVSSIARYFKCFGGNKARSQLSAKRVLKGHEGADRVFAYFQDLRDKHIIHDDNPYSQAFTGIALNARDAQCKVGDIVVMAMNAFTVDDDHLRSFSQLVDVTFKWVGAKLEELLGILGKKYEASKYDDLLALPNIEYTAPTADKVTVTR